MDLWVCYVTYSCTFDVAKTPIACYISKSDKLINLAVTCHWITADWTLEDALLDFKYVPGHHDGEHLGDEVIQILEEFQIINKLFCITTDNASNNGKMMTRISKHLKDVHCVKWDPKEHHIACLNHVINLAVQDFLKAIKGFNADDEVDDCLQDEDDDEEEQSPMGFAGTLWKIRTIVKVLPQCNKQMMFGSPPNVIWMLSNTS